MKNYKFNKKYTYILFIILLLSILLCFVYLLYYLIKKYKLIYAVTIEENLYDINEYINSNNLFHTTSSINKKSKCYDCEKDVSDESRKWQVQKSSCYTCEKQLAKQGKCNDGYFASGSISTI